MLYYPQLASGAVCQLPVTVRTSMRTVVNELLDGRTLRMDDQGEACVRWVLRYTGLTDEEWSSIEQLFEAAEGRLTTFIFFDPLGNLLTWSEDWSKPVWSADPLLQVTQSIQDPLGGSNAVQLTNASQTAQRITQAIEGASWFQYCYSVYMRSESPAVVDLVMSTAGQESRTTVLTGPSWARAVRTETLSATGEGVQFGIQLPPGASIQVFGPQVEAQGAASEYKRTLDRSGVYPKTRFDSDALQVTTTAPGQHAGLVTLVSNLD